MVYFQFLFKKLECLKWTVCDKKNLQRSTHFKQREKYILGANLFSWHDDSHYTVKASKKSYKLQLYYATIIFQIIYLSMNLLPLMDGMLYLIYINKMHDNAHDSCSSFKYILIDIQTYVY